MPTADRRRADAARKAAPAPRAPARAAAPPAPPAAAPDDAQPPADEPELEAAVDPEAWASIADAPPFNVKVEGRQEHGPFELKLNGRAEGTKAGEVVVADWARGSTTSGGFGWGWRVREKHPRVFGWGAVEAWRSPA